ncbi:MAG: ABC transporter ATP-binding protein [Euryarchaeota archaeon]|nr:ABC transporter ATP-binding protein [Euryarchaeota archaeon]MDE1835242.1 ABC transporter ATP-binding protein [Euryarchaeota archaeon]MDE1881045.1 ABC transporter ATP-binding protein [Euryarchaeota archaeon]MDE2043538.1 ABC transporter ATP-binding protein [Thermoplasmata archaeon]
MPLIEISDIGKNFAGRHGPVAIMEHVSFSVANNDFLAIVGPSGCGKSTLLRLIQGLDHPSSGAILFRGKPVMDVQLDMAMVFQSFALYPWLNVKENVALGLEARGWSEDRIENQVAKYIEVTGMVGFEEAYPRELSGGMRQRVGLARALAVEPAVLLMDEPFSSLDPLTAESLRDEVLELWADPGLPPDAVVLVTHNIEEAVEMADRILVLSRRPSQVLAGVPVKLPRPRDRKSEAFYQLTDYVYSMITEGSPRKGGTGGNGGRGQTPPVPASADGL